MMGIDDASSMACTGEMMARAAAASRRVHTVLHTSDTHLWPAPLTVLSTVCDMVFIAACLDHQRRRLAWRALSPF